MNANRFCRQLEDTIQYFDFGDHGQVAVYRVLAIPEAEEVNAVAEHWLSEEEKSRSLKYIFPRDQLRYRWRRSLVRGLLANYLDCEPTALAFQANSWGKPFVSAKLNPTQPLYWNLSDSDDSVVVAFSSDGEVGVDIEHHRPLSDFDSLARTIMHAEELARWQHLDQEHRMAWFFDLWSTKEALIKCCGYGLSLTPNSLSIVPDIEDKRVQTVSANGPDQRAWSCHVQLTRDIADCSFAVALGFTQ